MLLFMRGTRFMTLRRLKPECIISWHQKKEKEKSTYFFFTLCIYMLFYLTAAI